MPRWLDAIWRARIPMHRRNAFTTVKTLRITALAGVHPPEYLLLKLAPALAIPMPSVQPVPLTKNDKGSLHAIEQT